MNTNYRFSKKIGWGFFDILKKIHAFIFKEKLVWVSDHDGELALTVTTKKYDRLAAPRFWPNSHYVFLNDDGSVDSSTEVDYEFVKSWIIAGEQEKIMMYIKNYEIYEKIDKENYL